MKPSKLVSCKGKYKFTTYQEAKNTIPKINTAKIEAYKCCICNNYHVGYSARRERTIHKELVLKRDSRKLVD